MNPLTDPTNLDQMMEACDMLDDELSAMQSQIKDVKEKKQGRDATGKGDEKRKKSSEVKGRDAESKIPLSPRRRKPLDKKSTTSVEKRSPEIKEKVIEKSKPPAVPAPVKGKKTGVPDKKSATDAPTVQKKSKIKPPVAPSLAKMSYVPGQKSPTNVDKSPRKESPEAKINVPAPAQRKMAKVTAPVSTKEAEKTKSARKQTTPAKGDNVPVPAKRKLTEVTDQTSSTKKPIVKKTSPYLVMQQVVKKKVPPKQATQAKGDSAPVPAKRKTTEVHEQKSKANIKPMMKRTTPKEAEKNKLSPPKQATHSTPKEAEKKKLSPPKQASQAKVKKALPSVTEKEPDTVKLHKVPSLTSLVIKEMRKTLSPQSSATQIKPPRKTETEAEKSKPLPKETTTVAKRDKLPRPKSAAKEKMGTKVTHKSSKSPRKSSEPEAEKKMQKVPSLTSIVQRIVTPTSTTVEKPARKTTESEAKRTKPHKVPSLTSLVQETLMETISPPTSTTPIKTPKKADRDSVRKTLFKGVSGSGTSSAKKDEERVNVDSDSDGYSTETGRPKTNETYSEDGSVGDEASNSSLVVQKKRYQVRSLTSIVKAYMSERMTPKCSRTNLKALKNTTEDSDDENETERVLPIIEELFSEEDSVGDGEHIDDDASSCSYVVQLMEDENEGDAAGSGGSSNLTERSFTDEELADLPAEDGDGPVSIFVDHQLMSFQSAEFNANCLSTIMEVDENDISSDTARSDPNQAQDVQVPEVSESSSDMQVADSTTQQDTQVVEESESASEIQHDEQATEETQPEETQPEESAEVTEATQPEESTEATEELLFEESAELSGSSSLMGYGEDDDIELTGPASAIGGEDNDQLEAELTGPLSGIDEDDDELEAVLSGSSSVVGGDEDDELVAEGSGSSAIGGDGEEVDETVVSDSSSAVAGNEDAENLSEPSSENLGDEEPELGDEEPELEDEEPEFGEEEDEGEELVLSNDDALQVRPLNENWAANEDFWDDDAPELSDNSTQTATPYQEETAPEVDSAGDEASSGSVDNTLLQLENLDEGPSKISPIAEPSTKVPKPQRSSTKTPRQTPRRTDTIESREIPKPKGRSSGAQRMSSIGKSIPIDSSDEELGILSDRIDEESVQVQQFAEGQEVLDGHDVKEVRESGEQPQSTVVDERPAEGRQKTQPSNPSWLHMEAKTIDLGCVDAATQKQSRDPAKYYGAQFTDSATTSESNLYAAPIAPQVRDNAPQSQAVRFEERYPYEYDDESDREWGSQPERPTRGRGRSRIGGRGARGGRARGVSKERPASQCIHEFCPICNPQSPLESRSPSPERYDQPEDRNSRSKSLARRRRPQGNVASRSRSDGKSLTYNRTPPQLISTNRNPPQAANRPLPQSRNQPGPTISRGTQYGYPPARGNQSNNANGQQVPTRPDTSPPRYERPLVYSSQSNARTALLLDRDNRSPVRANRDPVCSVRSARQPSDFYTREVANIPLSNDPMPEPRSNPSGLLIPITKLTSHPPAAESSGDGSMITLPDTAISSRYRSPFPEKCDINEEGNIHLTFREGIEVHITPDLGILMTCPSKRITIAISANNSHLGIMHPYGRLYQQDGEVQVQCPYRESIQRFATITEDNRVFLTNTHSTVVLESTTNGPYAKTSGRIFNVPDDIPQRILTCEGRSGREYQSESAALWKNASIENLVSNDLLTLKDIRINQMPNGSVSIYKENPHMRIQISPLTGACRVNTGRYRVKADSRSHLINFFLEQGTNRVVSQKGNFIVRNEKKSCGFDGWNRFKVDFRLLRNEPKMGEAYFEN